jgi:hypothetical protein
VPKLKDKIENVRNEAGILVLGIENLIELELKSKGDDSGLKMDI